MKLLGFPENSDAQTIAELNPQNPPENDTKGKGNSSENQPSQGVLKAIAEAGNKIIGRGRGRPRKDGSPNKSATISPAPVAAEKSNSPAPAPVVPPDSDLASKKTVEKITKGAVSICQFGVRHFAPKAGFTNEFTTAALARNTPEQAAYDEFSEDAVILAKKYGINLRCCEEVNAALSGSKIFAPFAMLFMEFHQEIKRRREEEEKKKQIPQPENGGTK